AQLLRQWHAAGTAMQGVLSATATYAARADGQTLGLLLLPDHHGPVPFARNAQGGVVSPPHHPHGLLDRVVPLLPGQFAEWQQHIADGLPARLKGLQPGTPVAIELLCLDRDAVELVALGAYQPGMQL